MKLITDHEAERAGLRLQTLADVAAMVQVDEGLTANRRRDVLSALRSVCRLIGVDPADAPARHEFFHRRLEGFHSWQADISQKRYRNIRSDLTFALSRYAPAGLGERCWHDVPKIWKDLARRLEAADFRYGLTRFIRFCGHHGIAPDEVNDAVVERFTFYLIETTLKDPERIRRRTVDLWNIAVATVDGWPQRPLTRPPRHVGYCPAWADLPPRLRRDAEAWLGRLAGDYLLAEDGPIRPARPATIAARRFQIRQIVGALVESDRDPATLACLGDLLDPTTVKTVLRFFLDRSGGEATSQTRAIAGVLLSIARYWAKVPEEQIDELRRLKRRVSPLQEGLTEKNRERLRQFDSDRNKALLLLLPQRIVKEVRRGRQKNKKAALAIQSALMIELLLMAPIRLANLAGLDLNQHIVRHRDRRGERVHLVVPRQEVKNDEALEFQLPAETMALLDLYLRDYRPLLTKGLSSWLFPGAKPGRHKAAAQVGRQVTRTVFRRTGLRVNVHLFRHIMAKICLDALPGSYEVVRRVLHHRSIDTTTRYYTGLEITAAARHYDAVILGLRRTLGGGSDGDA